MDQKVPVTGEARISFGHRCVLFAPHASFEWISVPIYKNLKATHQYSHVQFLLSKKHKMERQPDSGEPAARLTSFSWCVLPTSLSAHRRHSLTHGPGLLGHERHPCMWPQCTFTQGRGGEVALCSHYCKPGFKP